MSVVLLLYSDWLKTLLLNVLLNANRNVLILIRNLTLLLLSEKYLGLNSYRQIIHYHVETASNLPGNRVESPIKAYSNIIILISMKKLFVILFISTSALGYSQQNVAGKSAEMLSADREFKSINAEKYKLQETIPYKALKSPGYNTKTANSDLLRLDSTLSVQAFGRYKTEFKYDENNYIKEDIDFRCYGETFTKWDPVRKDEYGFDENGRLIFLAQYEYSNSTWKGTWKEGSVYDSNDYVLQTNRSTWNAASKTWFISSKTDYLIDNEGMVLESLFSYRESESDEWQPWIQENYQFNDDNLLIVESSSNWDSNVDSMKYVSKTEYQYNLKNQVDTVKSFKWSYTNNWNIDEKNTFLYDTVLNTTTIITEGFDNSIWTNSTKNIYQYDSVGNNINYDKYAWNTENSDWYLIYNEERLYDKNSREVLYAYSLYNNDSNRVYNHRKIEYEYNADGHQTTNTGSEWDMASQDWIYDFKLEYVYGSNSMVDKIIVPYWLSGTYTIKDNYYDWSADNTWYLSDPSVYYYNEPTSAINRFSSAESNIVLFPNPASEFVSMHGMESTEPVIIEVYDLNGSLLINQPLANDEELFIGELNTGTYIYKVYTKDYVVVNRLIKK